MSWNFIVGDSMSILDTPSKYIKDANSLLFKFIQKGKRKTKLNETLSLDYSDGGLGAPSWVSYCLNHSYLYGSQESKLLKKRGSLGGVVEDDSQLLLE